MNVGSNTNNGGIAGTFYLNSNNSSTNSNRNISTQLAVVVVPLSLGSTEKKTHHKDVKYVDPIQFGRAMSTKFSEELGDHRR